MENTLVDWDKFLEFKPLFLNTLRSLIKEGFDKDEAYDAIFDTLMNCCKKNIVINVSFFHHDAKRLLLRQRGMWHDGKKLRKIKQKANLHFSKTCLSDLSLMENIGGFEKTPLDALEEKEIKCIFFNKIAMYDKTKQSIWNFLLEGKHAKEVGEIFKIEEWRVYQIKQEILSDLKIVFNDKYSCVC